MVFNILRSGLRGLIFGLLLGIFTAGCISRPVRSHASVDMMSVAPTGEEEEESPSVAEEMSGQGIERYAPRSDSRVSFDWPVDEAKLTRGFLPQRKRRPHLGIDLAASKGTPILAAHDGTIIYTGHDFRGYGKMVMIEGREGLATLYAHLSKITVSEGEKVSQGQTIGQMGRTGHATGNHLHFEVRTDQGPVDPLNYLPNGALVAKLVEDRKKAAR